MSGAGTLTLSGTNTYAGATAVDGGALNVDGSLSTSSAISVAGSTTLGGKGSAGPPRSPAAASYRRATAASVRSPSRERLSPAQANVNVASIAAGASANILNVTGSNGFTANGGAGSVAINIGGTLPTTTGAYKLIGYSGSIGGSTGYGDIHAWHDLQSRDRKLSQ